MTTGATEAIAAAMLALVEPGDEVVALEPFYDSYQATVAMAGGRLVPVTLRPSTFALDVDALRAAVSGRTKVILLNTPHNPTGAVLSAAELAAVAALAVERDLVVVTDEVYEHLTFDGRRAHPSRHAARNAPTHAVHRLRRQDLLRDGMEDRLGVRP